MKTKTKILKLRAKITESYNKISEIQTTCFHTNVVKVGRADVGNYCKSDDSYWFECTCQDCLKFWREDQ